MNDRTYIKCNSIPRDQLISLIDLVNLERFNNIFTIHDNNNIVTLLVSDKGSLNFIINTLSNKTIDFPTPPGYWALYAQTVFRNRIATELDLPIRSYGYKPITVPNILYRSYFDFLKSYFAASHIRNMKQTIRKRFLEDMKTLPPQVVNLERGFQAFL